MKILTFSEAIAEDLIDPAHLDTVYSQHFALIQLESWQEGRTAEYKVCGGCFVVTRLGKPFDHRTDCPIWL